MNAEGSGWPILILHHDDAPTETTKAYNKEVIVLKRYSDNDYVFIDETGEEYISTPELDHLNIAMKLIVIAIMVPTVFIIIGVMYGL